MDVLYSKTGRQEANNEKVFLMKTEPLIPSQGRRGRWTSSTGGFHYVPVGLLVVSRRRENQAVSVKCFSPTLLYQPRSSRDAR